MFVLHVHEIRPPGMIDGDKTTDTGAPRVAVVPERAITPPRVIEPTLIRPPGMIVKPSPALASVLSVCAFSPIVVLNPLEITSNSLTLPRTAYSEYAGNMTATRIPRIAMIIINSMRLKPLCICFISFPPTKELMHDAGRVQ